MCKVRRFIVVMFCLLAVGSTIPSVTSASTVAVAVPALSEVNSQNLPSGNSFRSRGSCEELVRRGLLSKRSCGYTGGKPKAGKVYLDAKTWICVLKVMGTAGERISRYPEGGGFWVILNGLIGLADALYSCGGL